MNILSNTVTVNSTISIIHITNTNNNKNNNSLS
jgi:hypothetical protein